MKTGRADQQLRGAFPWTAKNKFGLHELVGARSAVRQRLQLASAKPQFPNKGKRQAIYFFQLKVNIWDECTYLNIRWLIPAIKSDLIFRNKTTN